MNHLTQFFLRWVPICLAFLCITAIASADQFGLFSYTDKGDSIEITDYPITESGAIVIPSTIIGKPVTSIAPRAFEYCNGLTSITIPTSISYMGNLAFRMCTGLTSIIIPPSVTEIRPSAFANCSGLTSVTIPPTVTIIGTAAFLSCGGLTSITLPSSLTSIGTAAFEFCSGLTSITIPPSVSTIGSYAFDGCRSLASVTIPTSVTSIGSRAFENCSSLTGIEIPSSVTAISSSTFAGCSSLKSVTIPSSIASIGSFAFANCRALTSFTVPSTVTTIGESAFYGCRKITSFTISSSVTSLGPRPFANCTALPGISVDENNPNYSSQNGVLFNKAKSVLIQCPGAFTGSFSVPASVTSIDSGAFANCNGLSGISVDAANPNYSSQNGILFDKAKSLLIQCPGGFTGSFSIPSSVSSIAPSAFSGCGGLTHITLPSSITSIASSTFYGCTGLTEVDIPDTVTLIDTRAFQFCTNLQTVFLPASNLSIKDEAFQHCARLTAISLPAPPLSLGKKVFSDCHMLTEITIPSGTLTGAGSHRLFDNEFSYCTSLRTVSLPPTTSSISSSAFNSCIALEAIHVDPANTIYTSVQGILFTADMSTLIRCPAKFPGTLDIPASITSIHASAFDDCTELSKIRVASSNPVFSDINGVLYNKNQTQLVRCPGGYMGNHDIGIDVSIIQNGAFSECSALTTINVHRDNAHFSAINGVLYDKVSDTLIQVPGGYVGVLSIPDSVTAIGTDSISSCSLLTSVLVGLQNPSFASNHGVLFNKDQTTVIACPAGYTGSLAIPASVETITDAAFKNCTKLTSVVLPPDISSINAFTFMGCTSLESVTLPESVTEMGVYSFFGCDNLKKLVFLGDSPYGLWFWQSHYSTNAGGASVFHYDNRSWIGPGAWQGFPLVSMGTRSEFKDWLIQRCMAHNSDPELDKNMDGVSLLMAYALGLDPELNLTNSMPQAVVTPNHLKISFFGQRSDIDYLVKTSTDLINWGTDGVFVSNPDINGMREALVTRDKPKGFLKVTVTSNE